MTQKGSSPVPLAFTRTLLRRANILAVTATLQWLCGCDPLAKVANLVTHPEAETLQSQVVWNRPLSRIAPSENVTLSVVFENRTGENIAILDMEDAVVANYKNRGYKIVDEPLKANFTVSVTLRYFGLNPKGDRGRNPETVDGLPALAVGSGGAVGLAGLGIWSRMMTREYDLVADVAVGSRLAKPVKVNVTETRTVVQRTGVGRRADRGDLRDTVPTNEDREWRSEYQIEKTHDVRLSRVTAWAQRARLTEDEALQAVIPKMQHALSGVLPRLGCRPGPKACPPSDSE